MKENGDVDAIKECKACDLLDGIQVCNLTKWINNIIKL